DRYEVVDSEPVQVFQHFGSEIVGFRVVGSLQVFGNAGFFYFAGICARTVQEGSAGTSGAVDNLFGQGLIVVAVVIFLLANHIDQASPAAPKTDDLAALPNRPEGDGADCGVQ